MIYRDTQEEIDYNWDRLKEDGEEQQCGWVKERFGVAWRVVPSELDEMIATGNREQLARVPALKYWQAHTFVDS